MAKWSEPKTIMVHGGSFTASSDEEALDGYKAICRQVWDGLREGERGIQIMSADGKVSPLPDRGPYPEFMG